MKRFFIFAVLLVLALSLVIPVAAQDAKTLEVYLVAPGQAAVDWLNNTAFPAFVADHPGVTVQLQIGDWGSFDTDEAGFFTTGAGPDVMYLGSEYAAQYGKLLANLDSYLADWPDLAQYPDFATSVAKYDGHLVGLPLLIAPRPIYYRRDLFADPDAALPTTFADALAFVTANSAVENGAMTKMGYMDIGAGLFDAQEFIAYIWSAGGELYNEDGTSAFDSAATGEALQFMHDRRRIEMPTEDTAGLPAITGSALASGMVVSGTFANWQNPAHDDPVWANIEMGPDPAGPNGKPIIQVYTDWLGVPAYSANQELAADFLKFIGSKDNAIALSGPGIGFTPARQDAWADLRASDPVYDAMLNIAVEYGRGFSDIRASAELRPLIVQDVTPYLQDQASLEDTQAKLKADYDSLLEADGYLAPAAS